MQKSSDEHPQIAVTGDWGVGIGSGCVAIDGKRVEIEKPIVLSVSPIEPVVVERECYVSLPVFDANAPGWKRGVRLVGCRCQETSVKDALDPQSLTIYATANDPDCYEAGRDYAVDLEWATFGRLLDGRIQKDQAVFVSYCYGLSRIDSVVVDLSGGVSLRLGIPHVCAPRPPDIASDEKVLANVWLSAWLSHLTDENIFPVQQDAFSKLETPDWARAAICLPKTVQKLQDGDTVRILAWGDSVTDAGYLGSNKDRWQEQFVGRLQVRFPKAKIDLQTAGWGGRRSRNFVDEPDDSSYSYRTKVLGSGVDLIVSEFVNDSGLTADQVDEQYGRFLSDFRTVGAEWIILTPHYVRPDWMGLTTQKHIDEDPRPYVQAIRVFAKREGVALADASLCWGRLWRQGIPYTTLFLNAINHPDERGMKIFADRLMALFD